MIIQVLPIKRLPRQLDFFDYKVPDSLVHAIKEGQLITIPFRKKIIYGLVFAICTGEQTNPNSTLLEIETIVHEEAFFSVEHMNFFANMSAFYGVSPATLAKLSMLPLQKRKLQNISLSPFFSEIKKDETKLPKSILYKDEQEHADFLRNICKDSAVIFVPELRLIEKVQQLLGTDYADRIVTWHSKLSTKEQFERWIAIRNRQKDIVITTKAGVFLPFQGVQHLVIDYEHDQNHKQWDQQPRFHVKDVAGYVAHMQHSQLYFSSYSMSVDTYYHVQKGIYKIQDRKLTDSEILFTKRDRAPIVVEPTREIGARHFSALTSAIREKIIQAAQKHKDIFIFVNKKGYAPSSQETNQFGIGTQTVEAELRNIDASLLGGYAIVRMEKESTPTINEDSPRILIGTIAAFAHVRWEHTDLIVFLDVDRQLSLAELYSSEDVWHMIHNTLYNMHENAVFFIQSKLSEHFLIRSLTEPDRFYRTELHERSLVKYPPYSYLVRYITDSADMEQVKKYYDTIKHTLTEHKKRAIISNLFKLEGSTAIEDGLLAFTIKLPPDSTAIIKELNKHIPAGWKVDPQPLTLLGI